MAGAEKEEDMLKAQYHIRRGLSLVMVSYKVRTEGRTSHSLEQ